MNKSKKIIVTLVGVLGALILSTIIFMNFYEPTKSLVIKENDLNFSIPEEKSTDMEQISKFNHYQKMLRDEDKEVEKKITFEGEEEGTRDTENIDSLLLELKKSYGDYDTEIKQNPEEKVVEQVEEMKEELAEIIKSSNPKYIDEAPQSVQNQDIDKLLKSLNLNSNEDSFQNIDTISKSNDKVIESVSVIEIPDQYRTNLDSIKKNSFYSTNNVDAFNSNEKTIERKDFIQAEFYRNKTIRQGDVVEIRLLEDVFVFENFILPKGTVLYGIAAISPRRLFVRLTTNVFKNKSVTKSLLIHDFDGREGVYLKEQNLYKIPSEITKEITDIIKAQYSQSSFGGASENVDIKKVAQISGFDKIFKYINELTVRVDGGYKLWIKI
ncbi:conjugative transposon protein TraM [Flavobacteriaceae bacterium]|nr:conjugative transposon protein TraM [Flavobacteriaceae bacterium]